MSLRYIWEGIRLPNFMDMAHFPSPLPSACAHRQLPRASDAPHTFGIRHADRRMHSVVIGATGQGKTTLLRNVMLQDIAAGHGVALIDPHSDLASSLLDEISPSRTHQVVYFDPADLAYPLGMNIFDAVDQGWHFLIADQLITVFHNIWKDSWGPLMHQIFHNAVLSSTGRRSQTSGGNEDLVSMGARWYRRSSLTSRHFLLHPRERLPQRNLCPGE
jgi:hypothetical protein